MKNAKLAKAIMVALAAGVANVAMQGSVLADDAQGNKELREQMRVMMERMDELQKQVQALSKQQQAAPPAQVASVPATPPKPPEEKEPLLHEIIKGFYGTLDVSMDDTSKGIDGLVAYHNDAITLANGQYGGFVYGPNAPPGGPKGGPVGQLGYMGALSTNKSVLGYRGSHKIDGSDVEFIYQIE